MAKRLLPENEDLKERSVEEWIFFFFPMYKLIDDHFLFWKLNISRYIYFNI